MAFGAVAALLLTSSGRTLAQGPVVRLPAVRPPLRLRARRVSACAPTDSGPAAMAADGATLMRPARLADAPEQRQTGADLHGILCAYKPEGWTSFQVVHAVRRTLEAAYPLPKAEGARRKRRLKVGHGGTLDPLARGALVLGVGGGCRALEGFLKGPKVYRARMAFGVETDSQDCTGEVIRRASADGVTLETLEAALPAFRGRIMQRPPAFSAIKKGGKRSYDLARRGELAESDMEPREVHILDLRALSLSSLDTEPGNGEPPRPEAELIVQCGGGTYIRSLIVDIARAMGTAAHMTALERVKHGPFDLRAGAAVLREEQFGDAQAIVRLLQPVADGDDAPDGAELEGANTPGPRSGAGAGTAAPGVEEESS